MGRFGCNSPDTLVDSLLGAIKRTESPYLDFALYAGDFSSHGITEIDDGSTEEQLSKKVIDTVKTVAKKMRNSIQPSVPIFSTFGNADMPKKDYVMPIGSEGTKFLQTMLDSVFKPLATATPAVEVDFSAFVSSGCGYYVVKSLPGLEETRLIVFNSLFYSIPGGAKIGDERHKLGQKQFQWIREQLEAARENEDKVIIISHIPPSTNERFSQGEPQWQDRYVNTFTDIVADYRDVISFQVYGHFHYETIRIMSRRNTDEVGNYVDEHLSPMFIAPSISPFFTNNPSFRILYTDKKKHGLAESVTYFTDLLEQSDTALLWQMEHRQTVLFPDVGQFDSNSISRIFDHLFQDRRAIENGPSPSWNMHRLLPNYILGQRSQYVPKKYQLECSYRYHKVEDVAACLNSKPKFEPETAPII